MSETLGLAGKLSFFGDQAISSMAKVKSAFSGMRGQVSKVKEGLGDINKGFSGVGYAATALQGGVVYSVKKLADFEGQMGAVKSVLGKAQSEYFPALEAEAMKLGATTTFTAKEAAEAMENLARAGYGPTEILQAIGPVLDAAAAEGMDLATAAEIVAANMKAFGLEAKDSTHIADVLAYVSAQTATSIVDLQEGLKFAAPVARTANVSLEQTASILGVLSDIKLTGSLGGTAFKNAIIQMARQAKNGVVPVGDLYAKIEYGSNGMMDAQKTFMNMVKAISTIKDPMERVNVGMDLLGIRGQGVATAMEAMRPELAEKLFDKMEKGITGTSREMARMRLDNLQGDFVRLTSAVDGATITLGKHFRPIVETLAKRLTSFTSDISAVFTAMREAKGVEDLTKKLRGLDATAVQVVTGFKEGWESAKGIITWIAGAFGTIGRMITGMLNPIDTAFDPGSGGIGIKNLIKIGMQVGAIGLSFRFLGKAISSVTHIATGTFKVFSGVLGGLKTGVVGILSKLTTKFPMLSKLAGPISKLGGAVGTLEKVTAQPVRIVNWDEAGGLGGAPRLPGQPPPIPGAGAMPGAPAALGKFGTAMSWVAGITAAGVAGFELGTALDQWFGLSDKLSDKLMEGAREASAARVKAHGASLQYKDMEAMAVQLETFRRKGIMIEKEAGVGRAITQEVITEKLMKYATGKNVGMEKAVAMDLINKILTQLPQKVAEGMKGAKVEATLNIDGRPVAKSVATSEQENKSRIGITPPGARRKAAS